MSLSLYLLDLTLISRLIITLSFYSYREDIRIIEYIILIRSLIISNKTLNLRLYIRISTYKTLSLLILIVIIDWNLFDSILLSSIIMKSYRNYY